MTERLSALDWSEEWRGRHAEGLTESVRNAGG